mmetsp:Transcript_869/g.965  ORF Transcript_869/g.965 Transcript_869/m.965 type:complete len:92 (+) Transcript_869:168-443(+)
MNQNNISIMRGSHLSKAKNISPQDKEAVEATKKKMIDRIDLMKVRNRMIECIDLMKARRRRRRTADLVKPNKKNNNDNARMYRFNEIKTKE